MKLVVFFTLIIFAICARKSVQDCRVFADCRGEVRWQEIGAGRQGPPGKTGAPGPNGQKGEPGLGVNITELKQYLKDESRGPKLFYHTPSLTWESSKTFCKQFGRTLCTYDQVCPTTNGGRRLVGDVIHGDHWLAILDSYNDWVVIGTDYVWACLRHNSRWGPPAWGISTKPATHKGYVYCCETQPGTEKLAPDIRFQYIGKTTTYTSSLEHCENQGRRLCHSSEVCSASKPRLGTAKGNNWIAVRDRFNDWIQIGVSERTCGMHGIQYGLPNWGVREDGSSLDHVGFVYCCKEITA